MEQTINNALTTYTFPFSGTYHVYQDNSDAAYMVIEAKQGDMLNANLGGNIAIVLVKSHG